MLWFVLGGYDVNQPYCEISPADFDTHICQETRYNSRQEWGRWKYTASCLTNKLHALIYRPHENTFQPAAQNSALININVATYDYENAGLDLVISQIQEKATICDIEVYIEDKRLVLNKCNDVQYSINATQVILEYT